MIASVSTEDSKKADFEAKQALNEANPISFKLPFESEHKSTLLKGEIKSVPQDFIVTEVPGFEFTGEGQHLCVLVEKQLLNTQQALAILAKFFNVPRKQIGYFGLKDKFALSRQWFSIDLAASPLDETYLDNFDKELPSLLIEINQSKSLKREFIEPEKGNENSVVMRIVDFKRNRKKLNIGTLAGNYFDILVRNLETLSVQSADSDKKLEERLNFIKQQGFANYFGEQRFGKDYHNLKQLADIERLNLYKNRSLRSRMLSVLRAYYFNRYLSERIHKGIHKTCLPGDVMQFADGKTVFRSGGDDDIQKRLDSGEIVLTGPLFGKDEGMVVNQSLQLEKEIFDFRERFLPVLERYNVKSDRRALFVVPKNLSWERAGQSLRLRFELPAGAYATSLLKNVVAYDSHKNNLEVL